MKKLDKLRSEIQIEKDRDGRVPKFYIVNKDTLRELRDEHCFKFLEDNDMKGEAYLAGMFNGIPVIYKKNLHRKYIITFYFKDREELPMIGNYMPLVTEKILNGEIWG